MATRKKKIVGEDAADSESPNIPSNGWPKISQGTHLTVKTFEDGRTELIWDDDQLLKEVKEAIASVEQSAPKKTTKGKKKNVSTQ